MASSVSVSSKNQFRPFSVLFIGAGNITFGNDNVRWNHSLRLERHLGTRLQVVGIVDPSIPRVQHVLTQKASSAAAPCYAKAKHFSDLLSAHEYLKDDLPDLIIVATPPHLRGTLLPDRDLEKRVITLFGSSPALFCEKPVSTAYPHFSSGVATMLEESGNTISVGYMMRYLKVIQKAMQVIRNNNLIIMSVVARYSTAYSKMRKFDWWDKSKQCGPIVEQATHFCDLCRYFGGDIDLDSVQAIALEHYERPGHLSHQDPAIDESKVPEAERIPRATTAVWKYASGALGSLTHIIALHGISYSNEIVVTADGYQLRLVDLYTKPTLFVRTPASDQREDVYTYPGDDPFYSEFASLICAIDSRESPLNTFSPSVSCSHLRDAGGPSQILSSYRDAFKTYEFTWRIRDKSEESSRKLRESRL
ncbi:MAG: hypothetical protein M1834_003232 [Cirrosporium novae-zelandiae]|nr:MAG: hypothetical protein M1834_003232 [Cirrosporium novae-zelandiae]